MSELTRAYSTAFFHTYQLIPERRQRVESNPRRKTNHVKSQTGHDAIPAGVARNDFQWSLSLISTESVHSTRCGALISARIPWLKTSLKIERASYVRCSNIGIALLSAPWALFAGILKSSLFRITRIHTSIAKARSA